MLTVFVISESSETLKNNETKLTFIFVVMSILAYGREGKRDEGGSKEVDEVVGNFTRRSIANYCTQSYLFHW